MSETIYNIIANLDQSRSQSGLFGVMAENITN